LAAAIVTQLETTIGSEITSIEEELLHRFVPDDVCPMSYGLIDILLNTGRPKDEVKALEYFSTFSYNLTWSITYDVLVFVRVQAAFLY
nr:armadillo-type fold [Tanacetum cinerariifolium]